MGFRLNTAVALTLTAALAGCGGGSHSHSIARRTGASGPAATTSGVTGLARATGPSGPTGPAGPRRAHRRRRHPAERTSHAVIAAIIAAAPVVRSTGTLSSWSGTVAPRPPTPKSSGSPLSSNGATLGVVMRGLAFLPRTLSARVGQTIVWVNLSNYAHSVAATTGASFRSGSLSTGASFHFIPSSPQTVTYACTIHPGMSGRLVVSG